MPTARDVLNEMAATLNGYADDMDAASKAVRDPLVRDVLSASSAVLSGLAWAVSESADHGSPTPSFDLDDAVSDFLMARRVGVAADVPLAATG